MGPQSEPDRRPRFIKPQHHHYYYHCQRFSHLLTSTRLMIIAKEETTHNHTNQQRVSYWKSSHIIHSTYNFIFKHKWQTFTYEAPNDIRHQDLTIRIRSMRHHHETVELRPSSETSPRGLRGITPLQEAPPRGLRGITSWPWGITTLITSWNYVHMMRHHHEPYYKGHGITSYTNLTHT